MRRWVAAGDADPRTVPSHAAADCYPTAAVDDGAFFSGGGAIAHQDVAAVDHAPADRRTAGPIFPAAHSHATPDVDAEAVAATAHHADG
ncbi:MAG: hypothetical protein A3F84_29415 [Candidatus Handelsmanbacteria bacterium RIFCSPLOWO2_12_FULL_64_10]|uniref:Uncharacterized protein n=1 Tax=Handelsmanbacteria sp. (strain RIFCSPLOWO2_12_FULL_64_10) TaxID=1817868 RepID=A0A1F6CD86_HANXR|nr:MAG: hypothetical protein A3F84_29415 [Candidatus Handelsmanbacteria bacterium RIFCSPLOWO2_12_FULL_64_10]